MGERPAFIPVAGQSFSCQQDWINRASRLLTRHPDYCNTAHPVGKRDKGWRGDHFTALCFDQRGIRMRRGADFQRAEDENTYPVWWIWPDQIVSLLTSPVIDQRTVNILDERGLLHLEAYAFDRGDGLSKVGFYAHEVGDFITDPVGVFCRKYNVSREVAAAWNAANGEIHCTATTLNGAQCKNLSKPRIGPIPDPRDWQRAKELGGYCGIHGGDDA